MTLKQTDLDQFTSSESLYKHRFGLLYTCGVRYVATAGNAYWLIDAIASYQTNKLLALPNLQNFQIWQLVVNENKSATLICEEDTNLEILRQEIEYTDFPLPSIKLYLVEKVLMLLSEY
ncbi:MAG: hypothetical protein SAK29_05560 [Scytonema sp. PMC 1069.18]|nr:hypothetical protein [Scytonema sp. PMC 1069.18]MEC4884587.1 hypothetical protein [Scytonema sp. PMC 1070.18]